jgi:hypothetical protein
MNVAKQIVEVVTAEWFEYGLLPFLFCLLTVIVKASSKSRLIPTKKLIGKADRQDAAIGFDLLLAATLCLLTYSASLTKGKPEVPPYATQQQVEQINKKVDEITTKQTAALYFIGFLILLIFVLMNVVSDYGWEKTTELNCFGILCPLISGLVVFYLLLAFVR